MKTLMTSPSKRQKKEESLQIALSTYIKLQYPDVVFTAESSGIRLTMGQAVKAKKCRSEDKQPDMIIMEPRGGYYGLVIELKKEDKSPFLKDGTLSKGEHIQEQERTLAKLRKKGYHAVFGVGIDACIRIVDTYMSKWPTLNHVV